MALSLVYFTHGWMVIVHCCILLQQVNTLSSRLNRDYSCASKYFLRNQIEKTTTKIIIKMLMVLGFKILSLGFFNEYWWYNTLTRENNWFLNVLVRSNFATPTPFGGISCFVVGVDLSYYNLNSVLIHQASHSKGYQSYLMHREVLGSKKIGRYPIKLSEVLIYNEVFHRWSSKQWIFLIGRFANISVVWRWPNGYPQVVIRNKIRFQSEDFICWTC